MGEAPGGSALRITDLAQQLDLSPTPIREALARLAGEGLVDERRGEGYFTWRMEAADLVEWYQLSAIYVQAALAVSAPVALNGRGLADMFDGAPPASAGGVVYATYVEALVDRMTATGGNRTMRVLQARLADLLSPARRVEPLVISGACEEILDIARRFEAGEHEVLTTAVAQFYARRRQAAHKVIACLRHSRALD
jgi:hypothetical protein